MELYKNLNVQLVESFGKLEKLCNQIYQSRHGVTNYIDDMVCLDRSGSYSIAGWSNDLRHLKRIRHLRNKLTHGEMSFDDPFADHDDIAFADKFRQRIMNGTDPLTLYRQQQQTLSVKKTASKSAEQTYRSTPASSNRSSDSPLGCGACIALIATFAAAFVLFLFGLACLFS